MPDDPQPVPYPFGAVEGLDLHRGYADARTRGPLTRIRMPFGADGWLVTSHAEARIVLGDPRFSRAAAVGADVPRAIPERLESRQVITNMDPPELNRLRRVVSSSFTPRRISELRRRVERLAEDLVASMLTGGPPADLVAAVTAPLPLAVTCEMLGVALQDQATFRAGAAAIMSTADTPTEQRRQAACDLRRSVADLVAARRRGAVRGDDLLGAMVAARAEGDERLSEAELVDLALALMVAGHETTANMAGNAVVLLLGDRARWQSLVADPSSVDGAVEELLRFIPLGLHAGAGRVALSDVVLPDGTVVRRGETVLVAHAAANRDPAVFDDPERLDLGRGGERAGHLTFGAGPHHCLGAALARAELQVLLHCLVTKVPSLSLAERPEDVTWRRGAAIRGPERLPVTW